MGKKRELSGNPSEKFEMFYDVSVVTTYKDNEQHVIADFGMYNESEYNGTEIIDYTLMQSTGLFDKNSVEIYESDIVKWWYSEGNLISQKGKFEVVFENGAFRPGRNSDDTIYSFLEECEHDWYEVIGNIHENQELFEEL
ncbi:hypothetical protein GMD32_13305 [Parasutterella excrementihominis]|uniref:YopX family protein n=1 Tax=Parasutterella excrementihominis TaxID=487175 RepID=UPI0012BD7BD1|nr:YopX family protein [Parasutterella excrementihominis]MTU22445.1 hypothetical protein [Parasutterella excrementihominis]